MDNHELLSRLKAGEVVPLRGAEAESALAAFELVREEDARLFGPIRILRAGDDVLVAERPEPGELAFRRLAGLAEAEAFVRERLETYERMWDGCGCRIDYYR
jgi:hypothetical protein